MKRSREVLLPLGNPKKSVCKSPTEKVEPPPVRGGNWYQQFSTYFFGGRELDVEKYFRFFHEDSSRPRLGG